MLQQPIANHDEDDLDLLEGLGAGHWRDDIANQMWNDYRDELQMRDEEA
jgi:hypothetical protein